MRNKQPLDNITINLTLFKVSKTYRIPIFDESFDFCAFMGESGLAKIYYFIFQHFSKFTNANHSCPYQHDIIYYGIDNERFLSEIPAPKGNYILQMRVAIYKKWKVIVKFFAVQH
ncbi:uncharacterized protein LOC117572322 [Drosophila albomicans]|uniref:Uncharacterized protein LOC117572322 n=1 Tax=Drosophila albomicans TaxID=7291 RepID=A0A6P8Z1V8_DROAB|nr:uncharacterized protein LOC117572322 [Drosophila albomicans]